MTTKLKPADRIDILRKVASVGTDHMDTKERDLLVQVLCIELLEVSTALRVLVGDLDDTTDMFREALLLRKHIADGLGNYGTLGVATAVACGGEATS